MTTMVGVLCDVCDKESFQLQEREAFITDTVSVKVKCCLCCIRRIDSEAKQKSDAELLKLMDKVERKQLLKERSHEWARSFNGKQVVINYVVSNGYGDWVKGEFSIKGMAQCGGQESGGWGRVKIVVDESEYRRISYTKDFQWEKQHGVMTKVYYDSPMVDGHRWGLSLITHGYHHELEQPFAFYIKWGERNEFDIEVVG